MIKIPEQIIHDWKDYKNKVEEYKKGILDPVRFKTHRVSMGVYEQRKTDSFMVRTKITAGILSLKQLKGINELADKYGNGYIHLTTRQDVQFHGVTLDHTISIIEGLGELDVITRGAGGNTVRNVTCSALSGVAQDEVFDVSAYAEATTTYLLQDPTTLNLPRKYKIAFSNTPEDTANATISDLGFIAKIQNGKKGFEVYGGGGLGGSSAVSIKLAEFIPHNEFLYHVQAMKEVFEKEGDRTNKNKARIRYIRHRLGDEGFINRYNQQLENVKKERNLDMDITDEAFNGSSQNVIEKRGNGLIQQQRKGYSSIYIHPENGNITTAEFGKILAFIDRLGYDVSLRVTNTQGLVVRDLVDKDAEELLKIKSEFTSSYDIDHSVACAGAATCKLGLCLSQNLLSAVTKRFKEAGDNIKSQLPRVYISGCPNSCGQHQIGKIGLSGKAKRTEDGLIPTYIIYFEGGVGADRAVLGKEYGEIPAKKIPNFLYDLAQLKEETGHDDFSTLISKENKRIEALIEAFSKFDLKKENPDLYYDFGSEEEFSLKGRGPGECSAGVLDVVKLDLSNGEEGLKNYKRTKSSMALYKSGLAAARALLVLKGVDTAKDRVIFKEFTEHFIDTGYVKDGSKDVIDSLMDFKIGDLETLEGYYEEISYLVHRVRAIFDSLSPQLEITLEKEKKSEHEEIGAQTGEEEKEIVDLKGIQCPINFVKAKIALAKIPSGEELGFYLDDGEPINNVPRSLEAEGHGIIDIHRDYDGYNLLVVKKK